MTTPRETVWIAALLALILAVNLTTLERSPTVWIDEVTYIDPGVNLAGGKGFTSSAWYSGPKERPWVGNTPLYPVLVAGWVKVFGLEMVPVRLLNVFFYFLAVFLVWWGVVKTRLLATASARIGLVALLLLGFGPTFIYRNGRPDALLVLLFAVVFLGCCIERRWLRYALVAGGSFLVPFAGLSGLPYLALCGFLWLALVGWRGLADVVVAGVASAIGLGVLYAGYSSLDMWEGFRASTSAHSTMMLLDQGLQPLVARRLNEFKEFRGDLSLLALLSGLLAVAAAGLAWRGLALPSPAVRLLLFALLVPAVMLIVGTFPVYYGWMSYVPLVFAWALWLDTLSRSGSAVPGVLLVRLACLALGAVVALAGLPLRTGLAVSQWSARDYDPVRRLAKEVVGPDDVVFCSPQAYYPVKLAAKATYTASYSKVMSDAERDEVTLLIIDPETFGKFEEFFGCEWQPVGEEAAVASARNKFGASTYNLRAWRRSHR